MKYLILNLRKEGKTVIMCSHRLDDVQDVYDRIAILYDGELQENLGKVDRLPEVANRVRRFEPDRPGSELPIWNAIWRR